MTVIAARFDAFEDPEPLLSGCKQYPVVIYAVTSEHQVSQCLSLLNSQEKNRAQQFRFRQHRERFIVRRGLLRMLLSSLTGQAPDTIEIAQNAHGKPFLVQHPNLHFNLAHSNELVCFTFAEGMRLGVDVEFIRAVPDLGKMGRIVFCSEDVQWIEKQAVPESAFFKIWARAEAYVKAIGTGFQERLAEQLQSSTDHCVVPSSGSSTKWKITDVTVAPGYAAALAIETNAR